VSEPLLSEDTDLERLVANIRAVHGDAATFMYHDSVRRGGVLGFFAREVHRVAYQVADGADESDGATASGPAQPSEPTSWSEPASWSESPIGTESPNWNESASWTESTSWSEPTSWSEAPSWTPALSEQGTPSVGGEALGPISLAPPVATHAAETAVPDAEPASARPFEIVGALSPSDIAERAARLYGQEPPRAAGAHRAEPQLEASALLEVLAAAEAAENRAAFSELPAASDFAQVLQETLAISDADPYSAGAGGQRADTADAGIYRELFPIGETAVEAPTAVEDHDGWQQFLAELNAKSSAGLAGGAAPSAPSATTSATSAAAASEIAASQPPDSIASVTQMSNSPARARLDVLMQLREVGVPVAVNPRSETNSIYQAMDEVLAELPPAPALPRGAGDVIALIGELTPALRTAAVLAEQLRAPSSRIWLAGLEGHPASVLLGCGVSLDPARLITGARHAAALHTELTSGDLPSIVVIATDSADGDPQDPWAASVLIALAPTVAWMMVDATGKPEDERAKLDRLGGPSVIGALAVHSARISASPATTWDLGLPVALLDGRPANTFTWSSLLFGALHTGARHQATA
jgi:hypothetical protein